MAAGDDDTLASEIPAEQQVTATYKFLVSVFIILFLAPIFFTVVFPRENWPYTSVPVFAGYIGEDGQRFKFVFQGEFKNGSHRQLGYYDIDAHWGMMRYFFKFVYGSVEPYRIYNLYPNDTPEAFKERLSNFFEVFTKRLKLKRPDRYENITTIRLIVVKLAWDDSEAESHEVGYFDVESRQFVHSWSSDKRL